MYFNFMHAQASEPQRGRVAKVGTRTRDDVRGVVDRLHPAALPRPRFCSGVPVSAQVVGYVDGGVVG